MMRIMTERNKSCVGSEKHMLRLVTCARATQKGRPWANEALKKLDLLEQSTPPGPWSRPYW